MFYEGEVLVIDPETSAFETYVTGPLLPCLFGRIYDSETKRSLVFHKYAVHNMESILPYWNKFSPSSPKNLEVTLFTCQLSARSFNNHAFCYSGKNQAQEMNAVRDFLKSRFSIPEDNIERRFYKSEQFLSLSNMGQYESTPIFVGVNKLGEVFNTSTLNIDFYGIGEKLCPPIFKNKYHANTINDLPVDAKSQIQKLIGQKVATSVRNHYMEDGAHSAYWTRDFFSVEKLNIPAQSLGTILNITFGNDNKISMLPLLSI